MSAAEVPSIQIRRPELDFDAEIPRYWMAGNCLGTHVFNGMNLVFPDGERFFIKAVRDCTDERVGPELRREIRAFNGQEGRHAMEHERYFEILEAQGYEVKGFLRKFARTIDWTNRLMPASLRLAMTAGAEHYTATFGAFALEDEMVTESHPTMRKLVLWHAAEEVEHKHVAFDVLQATHPSVWLRRLGFVLATFDLFGFSAVATRSLVRQDLKAGRITKKELALHRKELRSRQAEFAAPMRDRIRAYWRRDFHPNETDERPRAAARLLEVGIA